MEEFEAGTCFDDYELVELIGEGGMGRVYRAQQVSLERAVAIKIIRPEVAGQPDFRARFAQEARVAAAVDHPHVVSVHRAGEHKGKPYLVMQWIEGTDLRSLLTEHGPLEPGRACGLVLQIASALDAIHRHGLLHRDVKPANILVRRVGGRDHAYLTDFGVARAGAAGSSGLTRTGYAVGTAGYTAPELVRGEEGDGRADLYGLSCVLFEALAGERPFRAPNDDALRWAHASDPRPTVSSRNRYLGTRFDALTARGMAISPSERFASGQDFAMALEAALEGEDAEPQTAATANVADGYQPTRIDPVTPAPQVLSPQGDPYREPAGQPPARRRGPAVAAALVLGALALAGVAVGAIAATGGFSADEQGAQAPPPSAETNPEPETETVTETQDAPPPPGAPSDRVDSGPAYTSFTPSSGAYTVDAPTGNGWSAGAEEVVNAGLNRVVWKGPGGETVWVDHTPGEAPTFLREGKDVTEARTVPHDAFGSIQEYVFTGGPDFCVVEECVVLHIDPGDGSGYGVIGGGGDAALAREVARRMAASLRPADN